MTDGCEVVVVSAKVRGSEKARQREDNEPALHFGARLGWKLGAPGAGEGERKPEDEEAGTCLGNLATLPVIAQLCGHLAATLFCPCNMLLPELTTLS